MMKGRYLFVPLFILLMLSLVGCTSSSPGSPGSSGVSPAGSLMGTIVDARSGLALWSGQAQVAGQVAKISGGHFEVKAIPAGSHTLTVSKDHYQDSTLQVQITSDDAVVEVPMESLYSAAHLDLLARLVRAEAGGEPYVGQVAVAASVLNRVRHPNYPNSLYGVITQRDARGYAQYSPIDNGAINTPADQNAKNAVADALAGWDPSQGATGFFAPAKVTNKNNWVWKQVPIVQIGNHLFFRAQSD